MNIELSLRDASTNEHYQVSVSRYKFQYLQEGAVYRVRGVYVDRTSQRNQLLSRPSTNFLLLP
jgi:hypothetical protein